MDFEGRGSGDLGLEGLGLEGLGLEGLGLEGLGFEDLVLEDWAESSAALAKEQSSHIILGIRSRGRTAPQR
jgi:hypothetical protein